MRSFSSDDVTSRGFMCRSTLPPRFGGISALLHRDIRMPEVRLLALMPPEARAAQTVFPSKRENTVPAAQSSPKIKFGTDSKGLLRAEDSPSHPRAIPRSIGLFRLDATDYWTMYSAGLSVGRQCLHTCQAEDRLYATYSSVAESGARAMQLAAQRGFLDNESTAGSDELDGSDPLFVAKRLAFVQGVQDGIEGRAEVREVSPDVLFSADE